MAHPPGSIFVSVVSYRDTECAPTINDLFAKAAHPERISVGAVVQYVPGVDSDRLEIVPERQAQVRVLSFSATLARGVCWARHLAQSLWWGESYYLQVDSHARFIQDWDKVLFDELARCGSDKPVLSTLCMEYRPPDNIIKHWATVMVPSAFNKERLPVFKGAMYREETLPEPLPSPIVCGHFLFAPAGIIKECPYDPHLYFYGEEISLAARLWTSGWDMFAPTRSIVFHGYSVMRRHWADHKDWYHLDLKAHRRVRHLLGIEPTDDAEALIDLDRYALGSVRTLAEYETFSGFGFREQTIRQ
jgi:hypothetical protein